MILESQPPYGFFGSEAPELGLQYRVRYMSASPFPHIVLDNFLSEDVLELCLREFPVIDSSNARYSSSQQNLKYEFNPDKLAPAVRSLFYSFNSRPFIGFLENLTGNTGLFPDPSFVGGGFHQVNHGGHLDVHADFNRHPGLNLERRLNVLIYLNKDWKKEYGGSFEIWNETMSSRTVGVEPLFNRCVIFNTSSTAYHGNPEPVNHPARLPRRAIALYYYTATWDGSLRAHNTQFRARPNSSDVPDMRFRFAELAADLMPPILMRKIRRVVRFAAARRPREADTASAGR
jgi:hypothetical protein